MGIIESNLSPQLSAGKIFLSVKCLNSNNMDNNDNDDDDNDDHDDDGDDDDDSDDDGSDEHFSRLPQGASWECDEMMYTLLLVASRFCDKILDITNIMEEGFIVAHGFKWVIPSRGGVLHSSLHHGEEAEWLSDSKGPGQGVVPKNTSSNQTRL